MLERYHYAEKKALEQAVTMLERKMVSGLCFAGYRLLLMSTRIEVQMKLRALTRSSLNTGKSMVETITRDTTMKTLKMNQLLKSSNRLRVKWPILKLELKETRLAFLNIQTLSMEV
jgi:hypothetical protein